MHCMDCGKNITQKRRAPSGSLIPRCAACNEQRWQRHWKDVANPHSAVGTQYPRAGGEPDPLEDPWG